MLIPYTVKFTITGDVFVNDNERFQIDDEIENITRNCINEFKYNLLGHYHGCKMKVETTTPDWKTGRNQP